MSSSNCCLANNNIYSSGMLLGVSKEMFSGFLESLWSWLSCGTLTGSHFFMPKRLLRSHTSVTSQHEGPRTQLRSAASGRSWGASYFSATVVLLSSKSEEYWPSTTLVIRSLKLLSFIYSINKALSLCYPEFPRWTRETEFLSPLKPAVFKRGRCKWIHR